MRGVKAKRQGRLDDELEKVGRIPLLIVDEVGYIPFDPEAASLFFSLVSSATNEALRSSIGSCTMLRSSSSARRVQR